MKIALFTYWVFVTGADTSVHTSVHPWTFDTELQCNEYALEHMALPAQLQRPLGFACPPGNTAYELQGGSPQRIE
jgi:hypothetical protein